MIQLKNKQEIEIMKTGGIILKDVLSELYKKTKVGTTLVQLDKLAEDLINARGAYPSFKKVKGYKWTICGCVNDVVVHGIPTDYIIKEGDIVGIDCGVYYQGFHTDSAWTKLVMDHTNALTIDASERIQNKEKSKFISVGQRALKEAIVQVKIGNHIYDISKSIQETIEKEGYSVVKTLVGHGVGRNLHEEPEIPGFIKTQREKTPQIVAGMVLAIEVIYNMGGSGVVYKGNDGWTIVTKDGKISGLFESTVAVTSHGCVVLTPIGSELT